MCAAVIGALGCAPPASRTTAEQFWEALRSLDFETAARLSGRTDVRQVELLIGGRSITGLRFEEPLENESAAQVPTSMDVDGVPLPLEFETHLVRGDDSDPWQVDLVATSREVRSAELASLFDAAALALRDGAAAIGEAIEDGAKEAARAIEQSLRDLETDLQSELDEANRDGRGGVQTPPPLADPSDPR